ncbi:uncharacterized protein LOC121376827 [Gigantopelta aegis]|uniref:uncharacterized protein LOC121376827 n=1 Tax=Gigantopelta aegis TaxID=1735272 RepID=UPI001B8879CE|nr:uncharacterized protein LOC121376827 [Gigantopelta aegis]
MSSTYEAVGSAVDGCTHSKILDEKPWWMVDLQGTYVVHTVILTNRDLYGCGNPKDFWRQIGTRVLSQHSELLNGTSLVECSTTCNRKTSCFAFNINVNSMLCELIINGSFEDTKDINPDWDYYGSDFC